MKQTLQLRLSQHLAMTPRLQQAIRLLQLSTMELHSEVQEALDSNLMLELDEDDASGFGSETDSVSGTEAGSGEAAVAEAEVVPADIPRELPVDSVWEDVYESATLAGESSNGEFNGTDLAAHRAQTESLKDRLQWQVSLMRLSDTDRVIAAAIIDAVDEDGYLTLTLDDIRDSLDPRGPVAAIPDRPDTVSGRQESSPGRTEATHEREGLAPDHPGAIPDRLEVTFEQVEAVLRQIQDLDPPGVAARSLEECLAIQLRQLPVGTEWRGAALTLVTRHLRLLASKNHEQLMAALGLDRHELQYVIGLIRSLSPRPGAAVESCAPEYVIPDVYVRKENGAWKVELNPDAFPKLRINTHYANLVRRADDSADNHTLKSHLQEARWFIKSLVNRGETLLKTATCIVERQRAFLEHGDEAMKPMVLADIAEAIGMHESTISRVTTRKYMHTPRGLFELKYFFSSHVHTVSGSEASSTAIRAVLRKLIASESPTRPLSDQRLKEVLSGQGIRIARRTVAKYRESMAIPPSTERKVL